LKILHINTERGWRGGERQTFLLVRALTRLGHQNVLAVRPGEPLAQVAEDEKWTIFPVRPWCEWGGSTALALRNLIRVEKVQIVHAHTGHAVGLGALAVWGTGIPLLATRRVNNPLGRHFLSRWKYRQVDGLAAVAGAVADGVVARGFPRERVRVIHSGVDASGYPGPPDRIRLRQERGVDPHAVVVVSAGALVPQKDPFNLLAAAEILVKKNPRIQFILLGEGPLRPSLERAVRTKGLNQNFFLWGHRTDVVDCTALADVFVLGSRAEGIGGALIDAMAVGVPTVATDVGGVADLYGGTGASELCAPGDATALADNIRWVLTDPAEASRRTTRGASTAQRFSAAAMADAYENFYKDLVQKEVSQNPCHG